MLSSAFRVRNSFTKRGAAFIQQNALARFSSAEKPQLTITGLDGYVGPYTAL